MTGPADPATTPGSVGGSGPAAVPPRDRRTERIVTLIVAVAFFMKNMDSTVLATSLPAIALDLGENPIHLKVAITAYLMALAIFVPISGWVADRAGTLTVFRGAVGVFLLGSIGCSLATDMWTMAAGRFVQGLGGAMMVPVGRLIVLRTIDRSDIVVALAWLGVPSLAGSVVGPLVGGFLTTYAHWRWIFWINVPIAVAGMVLATLHVPNHRSTERVPFDRRGYLLLAPGLAFALAAASLAGLEGVPGPLVLVTGILGTALVAAYVRHALRVPDPVLDLRLFGLPAVRTSVGSGFPFRMAINALPFLLPLFLQVGLGMSAFLSGLMTFALGVGTLLMRFCLKPILARFGFRATLIVNAALGSALIAAPALFTIATPVWLMMGLLFLAGFLRSLQFSALNALGYASVPEDRLSRATTLGAVAQELAATLGIAFAALGLEAFALIDGQERLASGHFPPAFVALGLMGSLSAALIAVTLPRGLGTDLVVRRGRGP